MTLIVEDGTGVPNANSYVDIAFADAYFAERGNVNWAGTDESKASWLIQGCDYNEMVFSARFIGTKTSGTQSLSYPRTGNPNYADDEIPVILKRAQCEYAVRAKAGPLMPDPTVDASGFAVVITKKKVGPIEKEFKAQGTSSRPSLVRSYPAPDALIFPLLQPGSGGTRVIR